MKMNEEKINYYVNKGYIDVADHAKFKYIVEILRLFNVNVKGWMRGSYILNENEGIMFTKVQNENWTDTLDDQYMYEHCNPQADKKIAKRNDYWGDKTIYIFRKEFNDDYAFIGCFKQDEEKIEELFNIGIENQRPYKKVSSRVYLTNFNQIK